MVKDNCWIYIRSEPTLWTVGFYDPTGKWHSDSDHGNPGKAAQRCARLNGEPEHLVGELADLRRQLGEAKADVQKWQRIRTPTHGACCTCQRCGLDYDSCRCDLDEAVDDAENLQREVERLRGAAELVCVTMEERGYADMPSFENLRAILDGKS